MLSVNKSLRKLGIVSVSALMLLSVGAGAMNAATTNAHAESVDEIVAKSFEKNDKEDREESAARAKAHGGIVNKYGDVVGQKASAKRAILKARRKNQAKYDAEHGKKAKAQHQEEQHHKLAKKSASAKNVKKRINKVSHHKKHAHKHVTRKSLRKQAKALRAKIRKAKHRKYHTRKARQNARKYIAKLNRQYRKLRKLVRK